MKNIITLLTLVSFCLAAHAQFDAEKEPYITRSLSNDAIKNVKVRTSGGGITVEGVNASEAKLEVYVRPNGNIGSLSKEEIQKRLDEDYELTITVTGNLLTAIAKQKHNFNNWKKALSISFKVYVPEAVTTDLATSGGSIRLRNLTGNQEFSTSGGSLSMDQLNGNINGKTSGGSITVKNSSNNIDLQTSGGSIKADNCSGTIRLSTSGGSLTLDNLQGNIKARTSGGSVHGSNIKGDLDAHTSGGSVTLNEISGSLETSTSGGSIHAEIKELGKYVTIKNSGGNVHLQLPDNKGMNLNLHANKISLTTVKAFSGSKDDNEMNGTINGGGIPVNVKASSGRLSIAVK
jgi:DUF4097 and DUF4098 domain-containing protein YvlB